MMILLDYRRKDDHNFILKNNGSTLITVIVAIAFVTILVSIILGTTVVNVRMKGIDKRTKDDFYYAERSLNDIYTGLGEELAKTAGDVYTAVFNKVGNETGDLASAEEAEKHFRKTFIASVFTKVNSLTAADLEGYILDSSRGHVKSIGEKEYQDKNGEKTTDTEKATRFVIKDVQVYVEDTSKYRSVISTDIVITTPTVDFLGTNADVSDYGLIANKGLYIVGGSSGCTITGNVYAGTHGEENSMDSDFEEKTDEFSRSDIYGGINIKDGKASFDGNYIISKGDINLSGTNPQIEVNSSAGDNLANLWFTSIRTIKNEPGKGAQISNDSSNPTIKINANIFALNDMILNADKSSVVIKGNYYGYNEGGLNTILGKKTGRLDSENSAIVINGSKAYLDMKDVNSFVLMGKAYIDFTSDENTDVSVMDVNKQVVPTAESVALKTNQQLYLVPPDFLDGPNPVEGGTGVFNISIPNTDLQKWFGYKYLNTSSVPDSIHKSYKVTLKPSVGGSDVYYDYLVFSDDPVELADHTIKGFSWKPEKVDSIDDDSDDVVYIVTKDSTGSYKFYKYTKTADPIGTGGSISSKAMFFLKIMTSRTAYEYDAYKNGVKKEDVESYIETKEKESSLIQPSAYRLYERIDRSMGWDYFDLSQCVVGDSSAVNDAHYYAKNAVINYERVAVDPDEPTKGTKIQSNVLNNTDGMLRYAGYTEYLYKRYMLLCSKLDGEEDKPLKTDPAPSKKVNTLADWPDWKIDTNAPLSHFVILDNIGNMNISKSLKSDDPNITTAYSEGLKHTAFGIVVTQDGGELNLGTIPEWALISGNFKGIAIVDGDIVVPAGMNVDGLLMASGTITLMGNNNINYNKGLIQSRIEKEMNIVKNKDSSTIDKYKDKAGYMNYYLISYLYSDVAEKPYLYDVMPGSKIKRDRIEADYNDFMHYENWQKGENDATPTPTTTPTPTP